VKGVQAVPRIAVSLSLHRHRFDLIPDYRSAAGERRQNVNRLAGAQAPRGRRIVSNGNAVAQVRASAEHCREPRVPSSQAVDQLGNRRAGSNSDGFRFGASRSPRSREVADRDRDFGGLVSRLSHDSAANSAHRADWLDEAGIVDAVPGSLGPHGGTPRGLDCIVVGTAAQQST
jgi:hypothetical protein